VRSLVAQAAMTLLLIVVVGSVAGQKAVDQGLTAIGLAPLPWDKYYGGFNTLVAGSAAVFWGFFLLTGISLFILRVKDRGIQRPFPAPLFPLEPIVFCGMCGYMLYSAVDYARGLSLLGIVPLIIGLPLYLVSQRSAAEPPADAAK
jgi:amino acid transporter